MLLLDDGRRPDAIKGIPVVHAVVDDWPAEAVAEPVRGRRPGRKLDHLGCRTNLKLLAQSRQRLLDPVREDGPGGGRLAAGAVDVERARQREGDVPDVWLDLGGSVAGGVWRVWL